MNRKTQLVSAEEMQRQREYMEAVKELPHRPETYYVVTFGCQMNAHD